MPKPKHRPSITQRTYVASRAMFLKSEGVKGGFTYADIARSLPGGPISTETLTRWYRDELDMGPGELKGLVSEGVVQLIADGNPTMVQHMAKAVLGINPADKVEQEQSITVNVMVQAKQALPPPQASLVYENQNSRNVTTQQTIEILPSQPASPDGTE